MTTPSAPRRVSLLALPESTGTPIHGLYETLVLVDAVAASPDGGAARLFDVEIVGPERGVFPSACGLPLEVHRALRDVDETDAVIMASMLFDRQEWVTGRHDDAVAWLRRMHARGADLCSACAGALLLAETGLIDGMTTTTHWAFAPTFRRNFPDIDLRVDELLVVGGQRGEFVMSGAASSWQDLVLHLIARHAGPTAAQAIGRFLLYHWDTRNLAPFIPFDPPTDHGDAVVRELQRWLHEDGHVGASVDELCRRSQLSRPTFNRRFKRATGHTPVAYLQRLRVEEAKRLLERTDAPVDDVCVRVGYDEAAAFRRVFKRVTSLTPAAYRRKFQLPPNAGGAAR